MEYILPYLTQFTKLEIIGLIILFILFCLQVRYYIIYYRKPYNYAKRDKEYETIKELYQPKVSVIMIAKNESERLGENLRMFLGQDYPDFEVVVVNKGSTDETFELLQGLQQEYDNIYHTFVPQSYDSDFSNRKLAITVGVKAAKGDIVLFTEAYSMPCTDRWISTMVKDLTGEKEVALGYSCFTETYGFTNKVARFDNHIFSMQYMSRALKGKPYTGTYRNIAFKKELFFEQKGFAGYLGQKGGEELFINAIMNERNVKVVTDPNSFTESNIDSRSLWREIKRTRSYVKEFLGVAAKTIFPIEYASRYLFYLFFGLVTALAVTNENWTLLGCTIFLFLVRYVHQLIVLGKATRHFQSGGYYLSLPFFELLQPLYNLGFRTKQKRFK